MQIADTVTLIFGTGEPVSTFLIYLALAVALSAAASLLLQKRRDQNRDQPAAQLAVRGTRLPWFIGLEEVGSVVCWAGDRFRRKEKAEGGKGGLFGGGKTYVWYESSMHALCIGPCTSLRQISADNNVLFEGSLTRESHPSGTLVDFGREGSFYIYWGEIDQPVNTELGLSTRIGIESRWRNVCYIHWVGKRLGASALWPRLKYVLERRPQSTILTSSLPWFTPTRTLDGDINAIDLGVDGVEGVGYYRIPQNVAWAIVPSMFLRLAGNAAGDQDFEVLKTESIMVSFLIYTKVFPFGGVSGSDNNGTLQIYSDDDNEAANPAHIIADALFAPYPLGLGRSTDMWDLDSLEDMGVAMTTEGARCSSLQTADKVFSDVIAEALEDLGYMLTIAPTTGLLTFLPIRTPDAAPLVISYDAQHNVPEVTSSQAEQEAQKVIYRFRDRRVKNRKMTFKIDDDGQATLLERADYKTVDIDITNVADFAVVCAQRRSQEVFGKQTAVRFQISRGGRTLAPGDVVEVEGMPEVLRVMSVQVDTESAVVDVDLAVDAYGVDPSGFTHGRTNPIAGLLPVAPDLAATIVEVPEYLLGAEPQTIVALHVRAHAQISDAYIHLSVDDSTYTLYGQGGNIVPGGLLTSALSADDDFYQAQGPTMDILGPDVDEILNLIGDEESWGLGRQLLFIGGEIFYLKNVTALGGDSYRLDGLVRARYDTQRAAHAIGAEVFIMRNDIAEEIQDILLQPQEDIFVKIQPTGIGTLLLSAILPESIEPLYGKGVRPVPVAGLRPTAPFKNSLAYATGDDVSLEWAYAATLGVGTGAGMQGAGTAVGQAPPDGTFLLEILNTSDVLKRSEELTAETYTYTNANLVADLGGEVDFKVRVTQLRNGYASDSVTITVEKI